MVFNRTLLGKWLWHYGLEREAWWRVVMDSKFSSLWGGWYSLKPSGAFGVGLWKNIKKGWKKFPCHTRFEMGDGSTIRFWHNQWCGDVALKEAFPDLFGSSCKEHLCCVSLGVCGWF
jgi:hypothetical protein